MSSKTQHLLSPTLIQHKHPNLTYVAILGVESTGKTTLCQDLAEYYHTEWVPEFMRPYLQQKWDAVQLACEWEDLMPIAEGQVALENQKANKATHFLFCDTSLFELMVYAYWYYGKCPKPIEDAALSHDYDLILLTEIDVPWEPDDLRDSPHDRDKIDVAFVEALNKYNVPYRRIGGNRQQRVAKVEIWLQGLNC